MSDGATNTRRFRGMRALVAVAVSITGLVAATAPAGAVGGFGDVDADEFYTTAVQWMVDNEITTGTAPGCFSPQRAVTRAEIATFIHRYAGEPSGGREPFSDVRSSDWFRDAVAWMVKADITQGTSPTTFEPGRAVTRGEVATFLHRYAGEPTAPPAPFVDVAPGAYYADAVAWMASAGITTGSSPSHFEPGRAVTRGEAATFLYRFAGAPAVALAAGGSCGVTSEPAVDSDLAAAEARSFELLNQLRAAVGAPPLVRIGTLDQYARNWSGQMDAGAGFVHSNGPYGENIAWWSDSGRSPEDAASKFHELWVNSAGHYANMTEAAYTYVGVGFWRGENGWYATHVFS